MHRPLTRKPQIQGNAGWSTKIIMPREKILGPEGAGGKKGRSVICSDTSQNTSTDERGENIAGGESRNTTNN